MSYGSKYINDQAINMMNILFEYIKDVCRISAPSAIFFPQKYPATVKKYGTAECAAWEMIKG
jgi:hypothetical protein